MRRRIGARAEIAGRAHQAKSKMMEPNAVDDHPRGERIVVTGDGVRQFEPAAALRERGGIRSRQAREEMWLDRFAGHGGIAAKENGLACHRAGVAHDHRPRRGGGAAGLELIHLLAEVRRLVAIIAAEQPLGFGARLGKLQGRIIAAQNLPQPFFAFIG